MKDNVSPEEKLLRLIRGKKKQDIAAEIKEVKPAIKPSIKPSIYPLIQKYAHLFDIQKIIWVVFTGACIYLAFSLIYPLVGLRKIKLPKITPEKFTEETPAAKEEVKPLEYYQQAIGSRQIFGATAQQAALPAAANTDMMRDINLVGIISGANPQAVIEDKKSQKTYYVTKGQFIGEMQVEDIQEGKIIINYRGQRYELYL